jgi:steroid delta-isomerase-like uncharacterized protein
MSEQNKAIVRRFVEEVQNRHNLAAIDELINPNFVDHSGIMPPELAHGLDGVKQFFTIMFEAFPDTHFTIHDQVAEGDKVVTRKTFHGIHQGEFLGIPATSRHVEVGVIDILSIVEGKIKDHWGGFDRLAMMQQLGAIPAQAQAS